MSRRLEAAEVANQAYGRWFEIFQYICPGMFDEAIRNLGQHVRCPLHGGENDFRFIKRSTARRTTTAQTGVAMCTCGIYVDGFALLQRATGKGFYEVLIEVDEYLNGPRDQHQDKKPKLLPAPVVPKELTPEELAAERAKILERLRSLWNAGKRVTPETDVYYTQRGIDPKTLEGVRNLRSLPSLGYYEKPKGKTEYQKIGSFPVLLGLMRDAEDQPVAIHRTWLSEDKRGKAPVEFPKKLTRALSVTGSSIRLYDARGAETLGICEGIETALAVRELSQKGQWSDLGEIPVWACFSANNIKGFEVPSSIRRSLKRLIVFTDNDEAGTSMNAALELKERLAKDLPHLRVVIRQPSVMGWDWLDYLYNKKFA